MHFSRASVLLAAALLSRCTAAEGFYAKDSAVLQVDSKSYDKLIKQSMKASLVEFYAPWCGHCQNLKPAWETAAKAMKGLGQVAAVNCDDEENKAFCGSLNVKGFPTLKTVRPTLLQGKPIIQDYNGPRTSKALVDALKALIPNHVTKLAEKDLEEWLAESNTTTKAIVFSEKSTVSAMIKVLSTDFYGNVHFGQVKSTDTALVERFGVTKFPSLVVLPGADATPVLYDGEMTQDGISQYLQQYASLATWGKKASSKKSASKTKAKADAKSSSSASSHYDSAASSHASSEASEAAASATSLTVEEPEESPTLEPIVLEEIHLPVEEPITDSIPSLESSSELQSNCLGTKTSTCILLLLPAETEELALPGDATLALTSLAEISEKHKIRGAHLFPIYSVPATNEATKDLRTALSLPADVTTVVAINGKRGWWRHYSGEKGFGLHQVEDWIDAIRLGEGKKEKLPRDVVEAGATAEETPVVKHEEL